MILWREQLTPNVEAVVKIRSRIFTVLNYGANDVYINFNETATTESLLVPAGMGRRFEFYSKIEDIHLIATDETAVQIDNLL